jgi:hypothetical protein
VVVRSKAQVGSRSIAGIVGSNQVEDMDVRVLFVVCCVGSGVLCVVYVVVCCVCCVLCT